MILLRWLPPFLGFLGKLIIIKSSLFVIGPGEFEIQIKIYLADPVERPVTIYHVLKLFQTGTGSSTDPSALKGGKSVVSEFYDEIIFQDPTQ